jgi:hypothetical protein
MLDVLPINGVRYEKADHMGIDHVDVYEVPGMDAVKPKHTFVYRIPDTDYFVASGFYVIKAGVYR